jgi:hypothetical protein
MEASCLTLYNSADPFHEARQMAHEKLDQWLDCLEPLFHQEKPPTLMELSQTMMQGRGQLMGGIMEDLSSGLYRHFLGQAVAHCPQCDRRLARKRIDEKQILTMQGPMTIQRPYFYCPSCRFGFHPMDEAFELTREVHQFDVQQSLAKLATHMPHDLAAQLMSEMTGVKVSGHASHENTNRIAEIASLETVLPDRDIIETKIAAATSKEGDLPVLVVSVDGAHVPIRPKAGRKQKRGKGHWREAKGFRMYLLGKDERIINLMSWHQITDDVEDFREDFLKAAELIPAQKVRIVVIADGADWIWKTFKQAFPNATEVLDYFHCSEHVHELARIHFGQTMEATQWAEATMTKLWLNQVDEVIKSLKEMEADSDTDAENIRKLINYLSTHEKRLNYNNNKQKGIPIGSGGIESSNKSICHTRMKRPGTWWILENGNQMLRLRCSIQNETFIKVFENYIKNKYKKF